MQSIIVDSGALVAMFDPSDRHHAWAVECVKAAGRSPLLTTWPCVTEATHILDRVDLQLRLLTYIGRGAVSVRDFSSADLDRFIPWMEKYRDRPMDFADASLLWLALETGAREILTTDRAEFETYRLPGGRRLAIL